MDLLVWRDSVAMADDMDAPHELRLPVDPAAPLADVLLTLLHQPYLAQIAGNRATWILHGRAPLAVVAQQWASPRYLLDPVTPVAAVADPTGAPHLQFRYWGQVEPLTVWEHLRQHGTPPPRWGAGA